MLLSIAEIEEKADGLPEFDPEAARSARPPLRADQLAVTEPRTPDLVAYLDSAYALGGHKLSEAIGHVLNAARNGHALTLGDWAFLLVSARSVSNWPMMIDICLTADGTEPSSTARFTSIPAIAQQYAMALNRTSDSAEAEAVIIESIGAHGADSESLGILGRIYKDRWRYNDDSKRSRQFLILALNSYWAGVQHNEYEIYPAINTLTLLRCAGSEPVKLARFASRVFLQAQDRVNSENADYFDFATLAEVSAAVENIDDLVHFTREAEARARAPWELETTASNLQLLSASAPHAELENIVLELRRLAEDWSVANAPLRQYAVTTENVIRTNSASA